MEEVFDVMLALIIGVIFLGVLITVVRIPIIIAKSRGVTGNEYSIISFLSWFGLVVPILWIIALCLSLIWKPKDWIEKKEDKDDFDLDKLAKLHQLYKEKVITKAEYEKQKKKIMG